MVVKTPRGSARCGDGIGNDMSLPSTRAMTASWAICNSIFRSPGSYSVIAPEGSGAAALDGCNIALLAAAQDERTSLALYGVTIDSPPECGKVVCRRNQR